MKIALIGYTESKLDFIIMSHVLLILKKKNIIIKVKDFDFINLPRDFLKEDKKYDIVVLNYIFKYRVEELSVEEQKLAPSVIPLIGIQVSDIHYPEIWRNRLINSEAKIIIIFAGCKENCSEICPEYLNLETYKINDYSDKNGSIWLLEK